MQNLHNAPPRPQLPKFIHPDDMPDMYALTGVGTCMEPVIPDRSCCVFDKREAPQPGDLVGLIFTEEAAQRRGVPGMIKRLVSGSADDGLIVVEQIQFNRSYRLPSDDVLAVHKFVGIAQSQGNGTAAFMLPTKEAA
jgi:hypothetical protein